MKKFLCKIQYRAEREGFEVEKGQEVTINIQNYCGAGSYEAYWKGQRFLLSKHSLYYFEEVPEMVQA